MKNILLVFVCSSFVDGVFAAAEIKSVAVNEGDPVTLNTCVNELKEDSRILWTFGAEKKPIATFNRVKNVTDYKEDAFNGMFKGRLHVNPQTGSLTIRNIRTSYSGLYDVEITSSGGTSYIFNRFNVTVIGVFDPDEIKKMLAVEGDFVTLQTNVSEIERDDLMVWRFGRATKLCIYNAVHQGPCHSDTVVIAKIDFGETKKIEYDGGVGEIFTNRLQLDQQTGSLTIKNIKSEHSGFYILKISTNKVTKYKNFRVTVIESQRCKDWYITAIVFIVVSILTLIVGLMWLCRKKIFKRSGALDQSQNHASNDNSGGILLAECKSR